MKLALLALLLPTITMASAPKSATLRPTGEMRFTLENQSGIELSGITFVPRLVCVTKASWVLGQHYRYENEASIRYSQSWRAGQATLEILEETSVSTPPKHWGHDLESCYTVLDLEFDLTPEFGGTLDFKTNRDSFERHLLGVESNWQHTDFTYDFGLRLKGRHFALRLEEDKESAKPGCVLALYREDRSGWLRFGAAKRFRTESCHKAL